MISVDSFAGDFHAHRNRGFRIAISSGEMHRSITRVAYCSYLSIIWRLVAGMSFV
ncbi:hypothetical protein Hanom_Chr12g01160551 [Helianthus anomalus]